MTKIHELDIVINVEYGGFHLDTEMALWLMENKGWKTNDDYQDQDADLIGLGDYFTKTDKYDDIKFRTHPDLIECVRTLQEKYKDLDYFERSGHQVLNLRVHKININIEVENYYDGKEKVNCWVN